MREFWTIFKIQLKVTYGLSSIKSMLRNDKKQLAKTLLLYLCVLLGLSSFGSVSALIMYGVYITGASIGRPELVLTVSFLATQMVVFFFGIFYVMGTFYFSNDITMLLPLPIKPNSIIASKLGIVIINEYLTVLPVFMPALIIYGIGTGAGISFYLKGLIILLGSPILPLIICALFNVILMNFANPKKSKDLIAGIGGFLGIVVGLGWNFIMQKFGASTASGEYQEMITSNIEKIDKIGANFPPAIWIAKALKENSLLSTGYLLLYILTVLVLAVLLMIFVNKMFLKSIMSGEEVSRKRKKLSNDVLEKKYIRSSSTFMAIFKREWKLFFKTPMYVLNGISGIIVTPIVFIMPFYAQGKDLDPLLKLIDNPGIRNNVLLGAAAIVIFVCNINIIANTAISREGKMFWISKLIPVEPKIQINAKLLLSAIIIGFGILLDIGVIAFILKLSIFEFIHLTILSLTATAFLLVLNLLIDVLRPKLNWTNPQEAVKQNLNVLFGIIIVLFFIAICAALVILMNLFSLQYVAIMIILNILFIMLTISFLFMLYAFADSMYKKIEI